MISIPQTVKKLDTVTPFQIPNFTIKKSVNSTNNVKICTTETKNIRAKNHFFALTPVKYRISFVFYCTALIKSLPAGASGSSMLKPLLTRVIVDKQVQVTATDIEEQHNMRK